MNFYFIFTIEKLDTLIAVTQYTVCWEIHYYLHSGVVGKISNSKSTAVESLHEKSNLIKANIYLNNPSIEMTYLNFSVISCP